MKNYIAILRGINVSGQKKVRMADLRELLTNKGFEKVETYIQSGNILFGHALASFSELAAIIHQAIREHYGFKVPVIVFDEEELSKVVQGNPFLNKRKEDLGCLHVTFLNDEPSADRSKRLSNMSYPPDELIQRGKVIYLFCPNGYGRTKFTNTFLEKQLQVNATTRNWKTTLKLLEMTRNRS